MTQGRSGNGTAPVIDAVGRLLADQGLTDAFRWHWKLTRAWEQVAGEPLAHHSWVIRYQAGVLTIGLASAAAATPLRFEADRLIKGLRAKGLTDLQRIDPKIQPQSADAGQHRHRRYSREAAAQVAEQASAIPDDDLQAAMHRLAKHLAGPSGSDD